jgi:hypothetical protein
MRTEDKRSIAAVTCFRAILYSLTLTVDEAMTTPEIT